MTYDAFLALAAFAFATSITPGPNNLMLMASGANFGLRRSVPHMLGIGIGFTVMLLALGLGLAQLMEQIPALYPAMMAASLVYLAWLAWKVATAQPPGEQAPSGRPITFLQAAAFQWVNVKAWAMALTALTAYAADQSFLSVVSVALIFGAINLPCVASWTLVGREIRRFLGTPWRLRAFNWTMAGLLVASTIPMLM